MAVPFFLLLLPAVPAVQPEATALTTWSVFEQPADPAAALERQARRALATGDNREAAARYRELRTSYARSTYAADAYYWEAFALYRLGGQTDLRRALDALAEQASKWPKAPSRDDAEALETRIEGALARLGDQASARSITEKAEAAERADYPARMEAPLPAVVPNPPMAGTARAPVSPRVSARARVPSGCATEDNDDRVEALNALMQMDADRALPVLQKVMARRDRCSEMLRRKAVFLISQKRSTVAVDLLMRAIKEDPDSEVREEAVFWLGQTGTEQAVTLLTDVLRGNGSEDVRKKAIFALAQTRSAKARETLRSLATDERASIELRKDAIFWLGQMHDKGTETVSLLSGLYGSIKTGDLRDQLLFAISQARSPAASAFLRRIAGDDSEEMDRRESAIFWFGQTSGSTDDLMTIYREERAKPLRDKVIFALSQKGRDPKAVDHLFSIARTETDRDLRKSAIFWLGQTKDPRVPQLMLELIDK
jgi:HEAT repeat protein